MQSPKLWTLMLLFSSLLAPSFSAAQQRVVVMTRLQNFAMDATRGGVRGSADDDAAAEIVTAELLRRGYRVVARDVLNAVLREQGLQHSGMVDQATAVRVGRLAGAGAIFLVNIYGKSTRHHRGANETLPFVPIPGLPGVDPRRFLGDPSGTVVEANMTVKLIDVQSAEIVWLGEESAQSRPNSGASDTDLIRQMVARLNFPPPSGSGGRHRSSDERIRGERSSDHERYSIERETPVPDQKVRAVQGRLRELGYDPGAVDGRMGERTRAALSQFQQDHNLPQTGRPDAETKQALQLQ